MVVRAEASPKDPTVPKILRDSELLRRSIFTTPPKFTTAGTLGNKIQNESPT